MSPREICVCIATYRRPQQLERLLASLTEQQEAPPFKVVVVDNDAERSAEAVAAAFREQLCLTYLVEPFRGLARVRNRAVTASTSCFLAFIDDDEWATPVWLAVLHRIAIRHNAAAVIGPVDFLFDDKVPEFIRNCGLFSRSPYADGAVVPWYHARIGNSLVRRAALPDPTIPFASSFDLTGGEDTHLFRRMIDHGALVIAASQARTFEYRPIGRANLNWVMRRSFRTGGTIVEVDWVGCDWMGRIRRTVDAAIAGASQAAQVAWHWRRDKSAATPHMVLACQEFGKVLRQCGIRIEEYRHHG
jgi:succinoglycan biosynthesis protein ExoM